MRTSWREQLPFVRVKIDYLPDTIKYETSYRMRLTQYAANMAAKKLSHENGKVRVNGFDEIPRPFIIGVCGGTASGKSTVCAKIMEALGQNKMDSSQKQVVIISMDSFYRPLTEDEQTRAKKGQYNFDHPGAFDDDLILQVMEDLKSGKTVQIPTYDPVKHCRTPGAYRTLYPADVILFEGILTFYFREVRGLFNMKLFVDTDADTRLSRRVMRDMKEWGRDLDQILHQYTQFVKPAFEEFCLPTKKYADVIIPRGADNTVAIDLIVQHIQELLRPTKNGRKPRVRHNSDSLVSRPH